MILKQKTKKKAEKRKKRKNESKKLRSVVLYCIRKRTRDEDV